MLAPTVPSPPNPQNIYCFIPLDNTFNGAPYSNDVLVISSLMPIFYFFFGLGEFKLSYTAFIMLGVNSLLDKPYTPPVITSIFMSYSCIVVTASNYNGLFEVSSNVLSSIANFLIDLGRESTKDDAGHGLYSLMSKTPTVSSGFSLFN